MNSKSQPDGRSKGDPESGPPGHVVRLEGSRTIGKGGMDHDVLVRVGARVKGVAVRVELPRLGLPAERVVNLRTGVAGVVVVADEHGGEDHDEAEGDDGCSL